MCGHVLCEDYLLGISDGRPRPRPKLSQWRDTQAACFMLRFDGHLQGQTGSHLLRNSEISTPSIPLGLRFGRS
jgi:hypothetical protein